MISREFLGWQQHALPAAASWLAERHGDHRAGELDLGPTVVVVPAARAGRRFTELLIREAEDRDLVLTPPRTATIGALPELLYEPHRPLAGDLLCRRLWADVLRDIPPAARDAVFPHPPDPDDHAGWHGLGELIQRLHREMSRERLAFSDAARACRGEGIQREAERWTALSAARDQYHRRLQELGRTDRHAARARALDRDQVSADGPVYLVGVVELPGVTRRMLAALESPVVALVHAPADRAEAFDPLGCVRTEVWGDAEIEIPEESIVPCGRPPAQAEEVLRRLATDGPVRGPDEVTIGVPDDSLVPHIEQRLEAYGVPHRYAAGTLLPETGPVRFLKTVARYLEHERYQDLAALIRHPAVEDRLTENGRSPVPPTTTDRYFEQHLPERLPRGAPRGVEEDSREAEALGELIGALEETLELGDLWGGRSQRLSAWMPRILDLLVRTYGAESLDRSRPAHHRLAEVLGELRDRAAEFHGLPEQADHSCTAATALRLLLSEVQDSSVPPTPRESAVEMLGWLELHLDDAPALVVTGMNDSAVPGTVSADLFLPDGLRRRLGLPHDGDRTARDAYLLSAILESREEAHLLVGRQDQEGNPLRPSRLLLATRGESLARRARRLFADDVPSLPDLPRPGDGPADESRFQAPPRPSLEIEDPPVSFRVTDFRLLLQDPYRWALERRLELQEVHDRHREMHGGTFGLLAHDVLEAFAGTEAARADDPGPVFGRLRQILEERARRRFGDHPVPAVRIQLLQLRARLADFARWHAGRIQRGWELVGAEVDAPDDGVPFQVDGEEVRLHGRIDRIERHLETGRWAILDYKTGEDPKGPEEAHRKKRTGEWTSLQLPLYRHLLPALAAENPELEGLASAGATVESGFVTLSREGVALRLADWSPEDLESADEAARSAIRSLWTGTVEFRRDRRVTYRGDPLGPLLGEGRLVSAEDEEAS